jgi:hypothetical protein
MRYQGCFHGRTNKFIEGGGLPLAPGFRRTPNSLLQSVKEYAGDPGAHPLFGAGTSVIREQT